MPSPEAMARDETFLLCPPAFYGVEYVISLFGLSLMLVIAAFGIDVALVLRHPELDDRLLRRWAGEGVLGSEWPLCLRPCSSCWGPRQGCGWRVGVIQRAFF